MKKLYFISILLMNCLFYACGDSSGIEEIPPAPEKDKITFSQGINSSLAFDAEGGMENIQFTASKAWTATLTNNRADSWCKVEPSNGQAGTGSISIKVSPNNETDQKTAVVQIKSGTATANINITQKQKDALTLTSNRYEVDAQGGNIDIEIKANVKYSYSIDQSSQSWITYVDSRALTTSYLKFNIAGNEGNENREGVITITDGKLTEKVTIYQKASGPSIVISKKEYTVSDSGETVQVEISSNVDVEIQMPEADWIHENKSRAFSTHTYYFDIAKNDTPDSRSAEIIFRNQANNLEEKVTINQLQKNAIVLAKNEYTLECGATRLDFDVQANVDFNVEVEADWITKVESRGLQTTTLHFDIAENTTEAEREGKIIISSGNIVQEIKVIQLSEKIDINTLAEHIHGINNVVDKLFMESETIEEIIEHVEDIRKIEGVADVWISDNALFIESQGGFRQSWLFTTERINSSISSSAWSAAVSSRSASWQKHDNETMKNRMNVAIINQFINDEKFNHLKETHASLAQMFTDAGFNVQTSNDLRNLIEAKEYKGPFDIIFYDTHGGHNTRNNQSELVSGYEIDVDCSHDEKEKTKDEIIRILYNRYIFPETETPWEDLSPDTKIEWAKDLSSKKGISWTHLKERRGGIEKSIIYESYTYKFFELNREHYANSIVFCGACYATKDGNGLGKAFGAKTFIGYHDPNTISHKTAEQFFQFMLQGMTTDEAFNRLDNEYRINRFTDKNGKKQESVLKLFGGKDICIIHPEVETLEAADIKSTSATLKGKLDAWNKTLECKFGFCYSPTDKDPTIEKECEHIPLTNLPSGNGNYTYTLPINNLEPEKTYYYRAYLYIDRSDIGLEDVYQYGEVKEFTTTEEVDADDAIRALLRLIYEQTNGEEWFSNDYWLSDKPVSKWKGVKIDDNGYIELYLHNNNLVNKIDLTLANSIAASALPYLKSLDCSENSLSYINLSNCTALEELLCYSNDLTDLNISQCPALINLDCDYNDLTSLDVSGISTLQSLSCDSNDFTSLNITDCNSLEWLRIENCTKLNNFNISKCPAITEIIIENSPLTTLNVTECTVLLKVECLEVQTDQLNIHTSECAALELLNCEDSQIGSLEVSGSSAEGLYLDQVQSTNVVLNNTALVDINIDNVKIEGELNIPSLPNLKEIHFDKSFSYNRSIINNLNISNCSSLNLLNFGSTILTGQLTISNCNSLKEFKRNKYSAYEKIEITDCGALENLELSLCKTTHLSLSECATLKEIGCGRCNMSSLSISNCRNLESLYCPSNKLISLNLSGTSKIKGLTCYENQLTELPLSECKDIIYINCSKNQISYLDLAYCQQLEAIQCQDNKLSELLLPGCKKLANLDCSNNQIANLNVEGCTSLERLSCEKNEIKREITSEFMKLISFTYDRRYTYNRKWNEASESYDITYTDNGKGWWYPGEPGKGQHRPD